MYIIIILVRNFFFCPSKKYSIFFSLSYLFFAAEHTITQYVYYNSSRDFASVSLLLNKYGEIPTVATTNSCLY